MPLRVFICDDDEFFASELAENLRGAGCEVRTRGPSPLAALDAFAPHLVLLDVHMPPPDGFELIDHIRKGTRRREMSLVLMSGAEDRLLEMAARLCHAREVQLAAVLRKPVRVSQIVRLCDARRDSLRA